MFFKLRMKHRSCNNMILRLSPLQLQHAAISFLQTQLRENNQRWKRRFHGDPRDGPFARTLKGCSYSIYINTISPIDMFFSGSKITMFFYIYSWKCTNHTTNVFDCPLQYNLRRAAKARIERMVKEHKTRTDLNAASHIADEWKSGDRNALADLLQRVNWDKDCSFMFSEYILICLWAYVTWFQHESTNYTCIYI